MKTLLLSTAFGLAAFGAAWAQGTTAQDFVNQAASGGMFEVQSSELAQDRSQTAAIQDFAKTMVTDHTANNEELKAAAQDQGLTVPTEIAGPQADMMKAVQDAEGDGFDAVYVENQIAAHESAIKLYQTYAEEGDNDALKGYAEKSLPVLQHHLEMAQGLNAQ